jgi:hypothetical protein
VLVDSTGDVHSISLNTVAGSATVRLDEGLPANYAMRSVSGRVQVDGVVRSGQGSFTTNYTGSVGELSGSFADVRANTVSGDITVLRRPAAHSSDDTAQSSGAQPEHEGDTGSRDAQSEGAW